MDIDEHVKELSDWVADLFVKQRELRAEVRQHFDKLEARFNARDARTQ